MNEAYFIADQVLEVDLRLVDEEEKSWVLQFHQELDVGLASDFPGSASAELVNSEVKELDPDVFLLTRSIRFTLKWESDDDLTRWEEDNTKISDFLIPSYVFDNYEGISIGGEMFDYDTSYG